MARRIGRHELIDRGAALTYYSVLSLIPGLLVLFSVIGLVGDQGTVNEVVNIVDDVGPSNADAAAKSSLESLIRDDTQSGTLLGLGLLAVLWTASAYIGCFFRASAEIWGVERRPVWRAWPLRVALTALFLLLLAIALIIIVLTGELASSVGDAIGIEDQLINLYTFLKWPALLVVVTLLVALLYRSSPSRERSATALAGAHTRGRGFGGGLDPRLGRLRGLRERVRDVRRHVRRARHDDRRARVAVAHQPDAACRSRARRRARVQARCYWRSRLRLSPKPLHPFPVRSRDLAEDHLQRAATGTARIAPITPISAPPTITTAIVAKPDSSIACR